MSATATAHAIARPSGEPCLGTEPRLPRDAYLDPAVYRWSPAADVAAGDVIGVRLGASGALVAAHVLRADAPDAPRPECQCDVWSSAPCRCDTRTVTLTVRLLVAPKGYRASECTRAIDAPRWSMVRTADVDQRVALRRAGHLH